MKTETKVTKTFLIEDVANAGKANESSGTNLSGAQARTVPTTSS